ncbi:MAG: hypothetical protein HPZ92_06525 [Oscillospiraceae bacterium]|nr:hypothetical protein [Oscillospiraceae bacterium]
MAVTVQIADEAGDGRPLLAIKVNICCQLGAGGVLSAIDQIAERFQIVRAGKLIRLSKCAFTAQCTIRRPDRGRQQADDHHKGHQQG